MERGPDNRLRTIAALAVLHDGPDAASLSDYLPDADRATAAKLLELYAGEADAAFAMGQLVRQMVASERFSTLAEVHPAWILERLREEPPRVIGLILRSLPSKHVRYLIKHLPPMVRARLPDMVESFAVAKPVLETIRRRFERHFLPMRISRTSGRIGFEQLYYLKGEELSELIRDAGLTELAIALADVRGKTLHAVLNRLDLKDAKRLQRRLREVGGVSAALARQARYAILEVEGQHLGPDRMLLHVGLSALAGAMEPSHDHLVRLLMQKMEPASGYLLKRLVDSRKVRFDAALAAERQELILGRVAELSREERISPEWGRLLPSDGHPPSAPIALPPPEEEETKTDQQLAE